MNWRAKERDWKRCIAWLPIRIGGRWYWMEKYWRRFFGDCYEVSFVKPTCDQCGGGPVWCRHCKEWRDLP